jgi:murein DD-endopeptidase MepM/ murein hydrolase activator NlpD
MVLILGGVGGYCALTLQHAEARVHELRSLTSDQRERLQKIDAQAAELDSQLRALRTQNEQIRRLIGDGGKNVAPAGAPASGSGTHGQPRIDRAQSYARDEAFDVVAARIERIRSDSNRVRSDGARLRGLALRVLNMHRLEDLARARVLASIPSLNPAGNAGNGGIASIFGWRVIPWPEFHKGVDLDADYGENVRAGAAGTVIAATYDGGYGNKIEIDHGNGYQTWYCHLSRIDVHPGQYVKKAEHIALVGSTGASTGPHLHYQIMLDGAPVDPVPYLHGVPDRVLASLK